MDYSAYRILVDTPAATAALGFGDYARSLTEAIETSAPQFAIGIFGSWGSGKTTLMRAVREGLDPARTIGVEFSAWRYEKEEQLLIPLLDTIREAMVEWARPAPAGPASAAAVGITEGARQKALAVAGVVGKVATSMIAGMSLKVGLPQALEFSFEASKALGAFRENAPAASPPAAGQPTSMSRQVSERADPDFPQSVYHACFRSLRDAFSSFRETAGDVRVVVFVDDLDRCLPAGALEVLEAMKLFFDFEGFVFVVGLDRGIVERFIEHRYLSPHTGPRADGAPAHGPAGAPLLTGGEYIKKIFQVPFNLAPVRLVQLHELLAALEHDARLGPEQATDLRTRVRAHLDYMVSEPTVNPREVKRYINAYVIQMKIKGGLDPDVVLALQTIANRRDWESANQALVAYGAEFLQAVRDVQAGDPSALAALDPELQALPRSLLEYLEPGRPGHALLQAHNLDEYLYSGEVSTQSFGPLLLDALRQAAQLRRGLAGDVPTQQALESVRTLDSMVGRLESVPQMQVLRRSIADIDRALSAVASGGSVEDLGAVRRDAIELQAMLRDLRRRGA